MVVVALDSQVRTYVGLYRLIRYRSGLRKVQQGRGFRRILREFEEKLISFQWRLYIGSSLIYPDCGRLIAINRTSHSPTVSKARCHESPIHIRQKRSSNGLD